MLLHCWTDGMVAVSRTLETVGVPTARYNLLHHSCRGFVMRVIILLIFWGRSRVLTSAWFLVNMTDMATNTMAATYQMYECDDV